MKIKGVWLCPACQEKNPNLKRHYRSVADLCILGFIISAIIIAVGFATTGFHFGMILSIGHTILLLVTIVFVYKSKTPWTDAVVKTLLWIVFGIALLFNVVIPLALAGKLNVPALIIYALVFSYLFWLSSQANKCTAPNEES
jgi:hypothetical protein